MVVLLPATVYALCTGCVPFTDCYKGLLISHSFFGVPDRIEDWLKVCVYLIFHGEHLNLHLILHDFL